MSVWIAWLNALIPLIAVVGAYTIALAQGYPAQCFPFLEGCTSISRAARFGDAIFWFRGLMLPLTVLLAIYWLYHRRWLQQFANSQQSYSSVFIVGLIAALALGVYANFLGSDGSIYRFMRQSGVFFYFGCTMLAQLLSLYSVQKYRTQLPMPLQILVRWQWAAVSAQWLIGLISLSVTFTQPEFKSAINNILEWNFALVMTLFYLFSALIWRHFPPEKL